MKKFDPYQIVTIVLSIAIVTSVGVFIYNLARGGFGKAALSVEVEYGNASVLVNGKDKGQTPVYTEEINSGNINVQINGENNSYSTIIKPAAGTLAAIKREIGVNDTFSSGLNLWFNKSSGTDSVISVISPNTEGVAVVVDGVEMGKAPVKFATKELLKQSDEDKYTLFFKKDGYQDQEIIVKVKSGYELNIRIDMFLKPISNKIKILPGLPDGVKFIMFSDFSDPSFTDRQSWGKGISYWLKTHGPITFDNGKIEKATYFIDDAGKVYNEDANEINPEEMRLDGELIVVYLGISEKAEIASSAKISLEKALGKDLTVNSTGNARIKIKPTGIGYLKVRSGPSTGSTQVGKVDVGKEFVVLGVKNSWYKIQYEEGKEGWVSGAYVEDLK